MAPEGGALDFSGPVAGEALTGREQSSAYAAHRGVEGPSAEVWVYRFRSPRCACAQLACHPALAAQRLRGALVVRTPEVDSAVGMQAAVQRL